MAKVAGRMLLVACFAGMLAVPAHAGGWASVRLDEPPTPLTLSAPWRFGFMVLQHDISPTSDVSPRVLVQHIETGEAIRSGAEREGKEGHFIAELTLPLLGKWKFSITPEPFGATSLGTLEVVPETAQPTPIAASDDGSGLLVEIRAGRCDTLGDTVVSLAEGAAPSLPRKTSSVEERVGASPAHRVPRRTLSVAESVAALVRDPHVVRVQLSAEASRSSIACGEVGGQLIDDELTFGLRAFTDDTIVAIAVLEPVAEGAELTLYAVDARLEEATIVTVGIEIDNSGGMVFNPADLTIEGGTTVIWTNETGKAHTVMSDDLAFESSPLLDFGQTFRQTFDHPGEYAYFCGPHPWMQGTIVVG